MTTHGTPPPAPASIVDRAGAPTFGTYHGSFAVVDLRPLSAPHARGPMGRLRHHKKWVYAFASDADVSVLCAIVDTTYATTAFVTVTDMRTGEVVLDRSLMGPPTLRPTVGDHPAHNLRATFWSPLGSFGITRTTGSPEYRIALTIPAAARRAADALGSASRALGSAARSVPVLGGRIPAPEPAAASASGSGPVRIDLALDAGRTPELSVVAPIESGGGSVSVTQKVAGLPVRGTVVVGERTWALDAGIGGLDYTHGYLARHTAWNWAFLVGRLASGQRIGCNLVEGFTDSRDDVNENALWIDDRLIPLDRARFTWDRSDPRSPWTVRTVDGGVDLVFTPYAVHAEHKDLVVVTSRFIQPIGVFSGSVEVDGLRHDVDAVPGVVEDQDVRW